VIQPAAPTREYHQVAHLGRGRHDGPGSVVCVMELASMLAGERFTDRPGSVCPLIGALLRAYNDRLDHRRRQDLYRYAADSVGTRADHRLQARRAATVLAAADRWDAARRRRWWRSSRWSLAGPCPADGPEAIARYAIRSLGPLGDAVHVSMLALLDELIGIDSRAESMRSHRGGARRSRSTHVVVEGA
jgi:hypothetical protein